MINPFRSEADAFRLLLGAAVYFGLIAVAAALGGSLAGLIVFVGLTLAVAVGWALARSTEQLPEPRPSSHADGERRILVVANETVGGQALHSLIERRSREIPTQILLVIPALNSRVRYWVSDEDRARAAAKERLEASLDDMRSLGIDASGEVGDANPLQAMEDALRTFSAQEIIISTHPEGRSNWLERGVVEQARRRSAVPITHVVVDLDLDREREEVHH
jgi:hypothetical protein